MRKRVRERRAGGEDLSLSDEASASHSLSLSLSAQPEQQTVRLLGLARGHTGGREGLRRTEHDRES